MRRLLIPVLLVSLAVTGCLAAAASARTPGHGCTFKSTARVAALVRGYPFATSVSDRYCMVTEAGVGGGATLINVGLLGEEVRPVDLKSFVRKVRTLYPNGKPPYNPYSTCTYRKGHWINATSYYYQEFCPDGATNVTQNVLMLRNGLQVAAHEGWGRSNISKAAFLKVVAQMHGFRP